MKINIFPPSYLNLLLLLEIVIHWIVPGIQIIREPYSYLGILLIGLSLILNVRSTRYLENQDTTSNFFEESTKLVVTGPFRASRNPIYLSGVALSLGIAIFLGTLTPFIFPILIFLILNNIHIPDEEARLEENFGEEFRAYKRQVKRWI